MARMIYVYYLKTGLRIKRKWIIQASNSEKKKYTARIHFKFAWYNLLHCFTNLKLPINVDSPLCPSGSNRDYLFICNTGYWIDGGIFFISTSNMNSKLSFSGVFGLHWATHLSNIASSNSKSLSVSNHQLVILWIKAYYLGYYLGNKALGILG